MNSETGKEDSRGMTSPYQITSLEPNEVFVFGSNLSGLHGAGAARQALKWGAIFGRAAGLQGQTYAIPTKDKAIQTLSIDEIAVGVNDFIEFAKSRPDLKFLVTEIGCGLAGYQPKDIAPLFTEAVTVQNILLPKRFARALELETFSDFRCMRSQRCQETEGFKGTEHEGLDMCDDGCVWFNPRKGGDKH